MQQMIARDEHDGVMKFHVQAIGGEHVMLLGRFFQNTLVDLAAITHVIEVKGAPQDRISGLLERLQLQLNCHRSAFLYLPLRVPVRHNQ